jgi:hypothetical protein
LKPWVTWFVDAGTNVVCGTAVTPGPASRESILAGLRAAITLEAPYGPPGDLPERVRIDRGKDFLSRIPTMLRCDNGPSSLGAWPTGQMSKSPASIGDASRAQSTNPRTVWLPSDFGMKDDQRLAPCQLMCLSNHSIGISG